MKLVKDTNPGAFAVSVPCQGKRHRELNAKNDIPAPSIMFTLAYGYSDIEGRAFQDYYCDKCAAEFLPVIIERKTTT